MSKATRVWCIDSPGLGGSELDLMRVLTMVGTEEDLVLHPAAVDPKLIQFFEDKQLDTETMPVGGNSWRKSISGLRGAFRVIRKFPNALFIIWSHHLDSNRWLQLALALRRSTFIIVERLVPSDRAAFSKSRLTIPIKRFVVTRAKAVILVGYSQIPNYKSFGFQSDRISVIPNSRPVAKIAERVGILRPNSEHFYKQAGLPRDARIILCVGRLCDQKNQSTLLRAAASVRKELPNVYVALLGDGPDYRYLQDLSEELMSGHVLFLGHGDPIPWLAVADVFVLPSIAEGLSGALLEAIAAGVPCITSDIPGNRELIRQGKTGLNFPARDHVSLANQICAMLTNRYKADLYSASALQLVRNEYDEPAEKAAWLEVFANE